MDQANPTSWREPETAAARWARMPTISNGAEYIESLRGRGTKLYLFGKLVDEPVDHPIIRPSINALRASYDLAESEPELATAHSPIIGKKVNRFLHIVESPDDLVAKNKMQRRMGQLTGTCFQRCTGLDTISVLHSITFEIDADKGTTYHQRFLAWLEQLQRKNLLVAAGMTDPKGDRSKRPHEQARPGHVPARDQAHARGRVHHRAPRRT
jgi:4-hydroxybutyryl-CoA dehydratase/vinylacetyl-CoA-Delta-isomerase